MLFESYKAAMLPENQLGMEDHEMTCAHDAYTSLKASCFTHWRGSIVTFNLLLTASVSFHSLLFPTCSRSGSSRVAMKQSLLSMQLGTISATVKFRPANSAAALNMLRKMMMTSRTTCVTHILCSLRAINQWRTPVIVLEYRVMFWTQYVMKCYE